MSRLPSQAQVDQTVVQGWIDAATAQGEVTMVPFYERILAALKAAEARTPRPPLQRVRDD